jgi:hypothetical protein
VNKEVLDSRSWKSSDTSFGAAAAASPDAYLRQHFPAAVAIGRVSRNTSRRTEGCSSRKAMVNCGRGVDQPKPFYNFMQVSNGRAEIKVGHCLSDWQTLSLFGPTHFGAAETTGMSHLAMGRGALLRSMSFWTTPSSRILKQRTTVAFAGLPEQLPQHTNTSEACANKTMGVVGLARQR